MKGREHLRDLCTNGRIGLSIRSRGKHEIEPQQSTKGGELLDWLREHQFPKMSTAPRSMLSPYVIPRVGKLREKSRASE
jgi:hypothetical protein